MPSGLVLGKNNRDYKRFNEVTLSICSMQGFASLLALVTDFLKQT
jgi:hypothetical protein